MDEDVTSDEDSSTIREMRQQLKEMQSQLADAQKQNTLLQRQAAFAQAGIAGLSEKRQAALMAAHGDGELTAEAIKATATELGFLSDSQGQAPPAQQQGHPVEEQLPPDTSVFSTLAEAMTGPHPGNPDLTQRISEAQSMQEVMALVEQAGLATEF